MNHASLEDDFVAQAERVIPEVADPAQHRRVAEALHKKVHEVMDRRDELFEGGRVPAKEELREFRRTSNGDFTATIEAASGTDEFNSEYSEVWARSSHGPHGLAAMYPSILISAVSDFEVLMAAVVRAILRIKPEMLRASDVSYTYRDIEIFKSVGEFRKHCADQVAESVLRGGLEDWSTWFSKRLGLHVAGVTTEAEELIEIFQRRHLWVHNGGVVNRFYLSKVGAAHHLTAGSEASVSFEYLVRALDVLLAAGTRLGYAVLLKLTPGEEEHAGHDLDAAAFSFLRNERFAVAKDVLDWYLDQFPEDGHALTMRVNRWLAQKRMGGLDAIREEVSSWRTGPLDDLFKLAQFALLDDLDNAQALAEQLVERGRIGYRDVRSWVLLQELRAHVAAKEDYDGPLRADAFRLEESSGSA